MISDMSTDLVDFKLPLSVYEKIQALATEEDSNPIDIIVGLVTDAYQRRKWLQDLADLRQCIQEEDGIQSDLTKDQILAQLRQTREEIFNAEYV